MIIFSFFESILNVIYEVINLSPLISILILIFTYSIITFFVSYQKLPNKVLEKKISFRFFTIFLFLNSLIIPRISFIIFSNIISWYSDFPFNNYLQFSLYFTIDLFNFALTATLFFKSKFFYNLLILLYFKYIINYLF
jgi:hypothetical protein